jgi:hypothetical protein
MKQRGWLYFLSWDAEAEDRVFVVQGFSPPPADD